MNTSPNTNKVENLKSTEDNNTRLENDDIPKMSKYKLDEKYNSKENYYLKYWELWKENEIMVAKMKEKSYEIELMKKHIENSKSSSN